MVELNFFKQSQMLFKYFRLWSFREADNKTFVARLLKFLAIALEGSMAIIAFSDFAAEVNHGQNTSIFTKALYMFAVFVSIHKAITVAYFGDDIKYCIEQLQSLTNKLRHKAEVEHSLVIYKKLFVVGTITINICGTFFLLAPFTSNQYHALAFTPHLPFLDAVKSPNWEILCVYEFVAITMITNPVIAYDTLLCGMMCTCRAILSSIGREIHDLDDFIEDDPKAEYNMKDIIRKITEISQLTTRISDTFSMTTMSHMIYNCNTMALGLFTVSNLPLTDMTCISMMAVIVLTIFQLWIYCYFGQGVVNQREAIQKDLCFIRWYDASKNFKNMLRLAIFESQIDRYVMAGKILPLSLEILSEVLKKAYAFFTFLNNMR